MVRRATLRMRSGSPTDVPPYFWTILMPVLPGLTLFVDVPGTLRFQMADGLYTLIEIRTATFKKDVKVSKRGELAKAKDPKSVVVALK